VDLHPLGESQCSPWLRRTVYFLIFFFSSRRRHTRFDCDWSSDVCSSDLKRSRECYPLPHPRDLFRQRLLGIHPAPKCGLPDRRRSEERRVGKERRAGWAPEHAREKELLLRTAGYRHMTASAARQSASSVA